MHGHIPGVSSIIRNNSSLWKKLPSTSCGSELLLVTMLTFIECLRFGRKFLGGLFSMLHLQLVETFAEYTHNLTLGDEGFFINVVYHLINLSGLL